MFHFCFISSDFKMFKPQVTVTCQHGCSQGGQPQNVPNEKIMFGVIKCLSQVITKFDGVIAGSSLNDKENAHSPNVPMFSPKSEVIYEKSSSENLSREVSIKEFKKDEQLAPESKNEKNLEVNIVGAKHNYICSECRGLCVASSPETRASVTDVTDRVSFPATSLVRLVRPCSMYVGILFSLSTLVRVSVKRGPDTCGWRMRMGKCG